MEDAVGDIVPATHVGYLPATALGLMAAARAIQRRLQALVLSEGTFLYFGFFPRAYKVADNTASSIRM